MHRSLTRFLITPGFSSSCFWRGVVGSCCLGDSSTVFTRVQCSAFVQDEYEGTAQKPARNKSKLQRCKSSKNMCYMPTS